MRLIYFSTALMILNGCAHTELEDRVCHGFREWVSAPIETDKNEKSVSFDWNIVDENSIPFYANMITDGPADEYDKKLYAKAAQATHYIELKKYSNLVSSCLSLRIKTNSKNKLVQQGKYRGKHVLVLWENSYCNSEVHDWNGCFTIKVK